MPIWTMLFLKKKNAFKDKPIEWDELSDHTLKIWIKKYLKYSYKIYYGLRESIIKICQQKNILFCLEISR